jgi:ribosomal protein S18 acetylase RimI-like enzyme
MRASREPGSYTSPRRRPFVAESPIFPSRRSPMSQRQGPRMTTTYPQGDLARRALSVLRDEGFGSFWFKGCSMLGYRRLVLLERYLNPPEPEVEAGLALAIALLQSSEVDDYCAFRPETARQIVLDRLRKTQTCFVARHEGRIVSACWSTTEPAWSEFLGCEIAVAGGEVYLFDAFTLPTYRGQGAAPALCRQQLLHFRQLGLRRATRATLPENTRAMRAHAKTGFRPYALLRTLRVGPWRGAFRRPWPGHHAAPRQ